MNGYSVVKELPIYRPKRETGERLMKPSTCFSTQKGNLAPQLRNFFNFSIALSMERLTGMIVHPSNSAICEYVSSPK